MPPRPRIEPPGRATTLQSTKGRPVWTLHHYESLWHQKGLIFGPVRRRGRYGGGAGSRLTKVKRPERPIDSADRRRQMNVRLPTEFIAGPRRSCAGGPGGR